MTRAPKLLSAPAVEPLSHQEARQFLKAVEVETGETLVRAMPAAEETEEEYQARVRRYREGLGVAA